MFCEQYSEFCETQTLSAPLGSPVLLPCIFSASNLSWVSWSHSPDTYLVRLTSKGRVKFVDPRHGRVKAFLNQGSEGNYSIRIDELKNTDLGCYRCEHEQNCLQVNLVAEIGRKISFFHTETLLNSSLRRDIRPVPFHGHKPRRSNTYEDTSECDRVSCRSFVKPQRVMQVH